MTDEITNAQDGGDRSGSILPTIEGDRVRLRWLAADDVDALFAIFSDPAVMRYWSSLPMTGRAEAEKLLGEIHAFFRAGTLFQWGIALKDTDEVIGTTTLFQIDPPNRRAEIGYALASEYWGKGLMRDALTAIIRHAFGTMGLNRLEADVDPRNEASLRILDRLGFAREGYLRERWFVGGEVQDAVFLGLIRREWDRAGGCP